MLSQSSGGPRTEEGGCLALLLLLHSPLGALPLGPGRWVALVTLLEVEVHDGVVPAGIPRKLGEPERLVCFGRSAEEPAREGSRLEPGGEPRVPPVEGEAPGALWAVVELHNVHWLQAEGTAGEDVNGAARRAGTRAWNTGQ